MAQALDAFGTLIQIGDGASPESWTSIAEVTNISGPNLSVDILDVTHHESPGDWKEKIATLLDIGNITLDLNFIPTHATHRDASGGLLDDMLAKTKRNFKIVFPDGGLTQWIMAAYVTGFTVNAPVEGKLSATVVLTCVGQPTLA